MKVYFLHTAFLISLLILFSCTFSNETERSRKLYEKGLLLYQYRQYDQALDLFDESIRYDRNFHLPHVMKRRIYQKKDEYKRALLESRLVNKKKPDIAENWMITGALNEYLGDSVEAMTSYRQAINLYKENSTKNLPDDSISAKIDKFNEFKLSILLGNTRTKSELILMLGVQSPIQQNILDSLMDRQYILNDLLKSDPELRIEKFVPLKRPKSV
jgi:tetratricopeptide (TPR) repeat protein